MKIIHMILLLASIMVASLSSSCVYSHDGYPARGYVHSGGGVKMFNLELGPSGYCQPPVYVRRGTYCPPPMAPRMCGQRYPTYGRPSYGPPTYGYQQPPRNYRPQPPSYRYQQPRPSYQTPPPGYRPSQPTNYYGHASNPIMVGGVAFSDQYPGGVRFAPP